ncbi:MAG: hypothetical protein C5B47_03635 [Verrucomicrobia bacterium]|nr:MAG: hypothetical protein C5B47_03635 [Verrucomicrobiota bacterium]
MYYALCKQFNIPTNNYIDSTLGRLEYDLEHISNNPKNEKSRKELYKELCDLKYRLQPCHVLPDISALKTIPDRRRILSDITERHKQLDHLESLYYKILSYKDQIEILDNIPTAYLLNSSKKENSDPDYIKRTVNPSDISSQLTQLRDRLNNINYHDDVELKKDLKEIDHTFNILSNTTLNPTLNPINNDLHFTRNSLLNDKVRYIHRKLKELSQCSGESRTLQELTSYHDYNNNNIDMSFLDDNISAIKSHAANLEALHQSFLSGIATPQTGVNAYSDIYRIIDINNQSDKLQEDLVPINNILRLNQYSCNLLNVADNLYEYPSILDGDSLYLDKLTHSSTNLPDANKYHNTISEIKNTILSKQRDLNDLYIQGRLTDELLIDAFIEEKNKLNALKDEMSIAYSSYLTSIDALLRDHDIESDKQCLTIIKYLSNINMSGFYGTRKTYTFTSLEDHRGTGGIYSISSLGKAIEGIQLNNPKKNNSGPTLKDIWIQLFCAKQINREFSATLKDFKQRMDICYPKTEEYYLSQVQTTKQVWNNAKSSYKDIPSTRLHLESKELRSYTRANDTYNDMKSLQTFFASNQAKCTEAYNQIKSLTEEIKVSSPDTIDSSKVAELHKEVCGIIQKQLELIRKLNDKQNNLKANYAHNNHHVALLNKKITLLEKH